MIFRKLGNYAVGYTNGPDPQAGYTLSIA